MKKHIGEEYIMWSKVELMIVHVLHICHSVCVRVSFSVSVRVGVCLIVSAISVSATFVCLSDSVNVTLRVSVCDCVHVHVLANAVRAHYLYSCIIYTEFQPVKNYLCLND